MKKMLIILVILCLCVQGFSQSYPGLRVQGRFLYDHLGEKVVLTGINKMIIWTDIDGIPSYSEIAKTNANCVRITWLTSGTPMQLEAAIYNCRANKMIPIPELHDATGDWTKLGACVDYWCRQDIVEVIKRHQQYLIINIANECGQTVADADYRAGYESAVSRMRSAGIHVPIMIDASGYGQNINGLQANGPYLIGKDPDKNLLFSIHMWWPYMWQHTDQEVIDEIAESVAMDLPLVVGEFGNKWDETAEGAIPYHTIIDQCTANQVGWIPWEWGPGNNPQTFLDMTTDSTYATLYDWGLEVAVTYKNSIKNTAKRPASLTSLEPAPTPAGEIKVQYQCAQTGETASQIKPLLNVINNTPSTVPLSDITLRYYYTKEGTTPEEFHVDYAVIGSSYVNGSFGDGYFQVGFTASAPSLEPGSSTGELQIRVNKSDYSAYTQSNDYSYDGTKTAYADWDHIGVFRNGVLVWGVVPNDGTPAPTAVPTAIPTLAPTAIPTTVPTTAPTNAPGTIGDANGSGTIDIVDALLIAQYYVGLGPAGFVAANADTNCSGTIDIVDALRVAQYYVGLITALTCP